MKTIRVNLGNIGQLSQVAHSFIISCSSGSTLRGDVRIYIYHEGRMVLGGSAKELQAKAKVIDRGVATESPYKTLVWEPEVGIVPWYVTMDYVIEGESVCNKVHTVVHSPNRK